MKISRWILTVILLLVTPGYVLLFAIPNYALNPERKPVTASPADVGLEFEAVTLSPRDSNLELSGWWIPADQARATMVFIHGGGSNRHSNFFESLKFYRAMVDNGVGVLVIDLRNHGVSDSDGQGISFGVSEGYDALAAVEWVRRRVPDLPVVAMGISMGGAAVIHAGHYGAALDGIILLDSVLDTQDTFRQAAWVQTALPPAFFNLSAWSATNFYNLPSGETETLALASKLEIPILVMQDPLDPVNRTPFSQQLANTNPHATLWLAPVIENDDPAVSWKERWGSHVAAFAVYPEETMQRVMLFINSL